jgi:hypothetical protein
MRVPFSQTRPGSASPALRIPRPALSGAGNSALAAPFASVASGA